ncbi:MAG: hypothetical protein JST61_01150 [Acidobacteria bacterium]|nr:hypothetical protein [Acidobacteriota bacterium]
MSKGGSPSIPNPWTIKLGSDGSTVHIDTDLDNIHIAEIAPINVNSTLAVTQPIVTQSTSNSDSKLDLKVEPLSVTSTSDSNSVVDLKPVAVDSCQTIKIAPLPPIRMEQPYSQHFGFTFMGMELFGFTTSGRYETLLNDPAKPAHTHCNCHAHPQVAPPQQPSGPSGHQDGGLRVRISGNR